MARGHLGLGGAAVATALLGALTLGHGIVGAQQDPSSDQALQATAGDQDETTDVTPTPIPTPPPYAPVTRNFVITSVPLVVKEMTSMYDTLKPELGKGGILADKEVYGFYPNSFTVYQGDTVNLTLVNPQDDPHTFTLPTFGVNVEMKAGTVAKGSFVASKVGAYTFTCAEAEHSPYMWGQVIVLPGSDGVQPVQQ